MSKMTRIKKIAVNNIAASDFVPWKFRVKIMRWAGFKIGHNVLVQQHTLFLSNSVSIGDNSYINRFCSFQDSGYGASFVLGKNVFIGPNCLFMGVTHRIGNSGKRAMEHYTGDITIEDGCWLGGNTTVLPGVTIARGCIIGAGAVVTRDTDPDGLYVGVPARRVKELS